MKNLCNAVTSAIWVNTQVYLGACEIFTAEACFEEWLLYLACADGKHINSDNSVCTADVFSGIALSNTYCRVFQ